MGLYQRDEIGKWENLLNRSLGKLIVRVEAKILIIFTDMLGKSITTAVVTLSDNVKIVSLPP